MVLRRPSPLNVFWRSDHCHQWFFDGFSFFYHRFQWFSMVRDHWSNDAMVSMDRCGLLASVPRNSRRINLSKLASFHPISQRYPRALFEELLRRKILISKERPLKAPLTSGISSKWPFTPNLSSLWQG